MRRRHLLAAPVLLHRSRAHAAERLNRASLDPTFTETFDAPLSIYDPKTGSGRWKTNWDFGDQDGLSSRVLNDELQVYCDPSFNGINPFSQQDGRLTITADRAPPDTDLGKPYTSGLLTTARSFSQRYGYFEMRAKLPQGAGLWPAFWLYGPFDPTSTVPLYCGEIDVMEMLGKQPDIINCSAHWPTNPERTQQNSKTISVHVGSTAGFRSYGALWDEHTITYYVDDVTVAQMNNPGLDMPMTILANLAVGGVWGGNPTKSTSFPAHMVIESICAYQVR